MLWWDEHGAIVEMRPCDSTWFWMYVNPVDTESRKFQRQFRRRFCMPHASFLQLVDMVKNQENSDGTRIFERWQNTDAVGRPCSPIERWFSVHFDISGVGSLLMISRSTHASITKLTANSLRCL
jgi:hypothetical protein